MKCFALVMAVMLCMFACNKHDDETQLLCDKKIVVTGNHDLNCGTPIVRFRDTSVIRRITGIPIWELCNVSGLPSKYDVIGKELIVCVRALKPEENRPCITLYPASNYPTVKLVSVKEAP